MLKGKDKHRDDLKYRHEFKYEVDIQQLIVLKERLTEIIPLDKNTNETGSYRIRSLYFDD